MDAVYNKILVGGNNFNGTLRVEATLVDGVLNLALYFDGHQQWADLGVRKSECWGNADLCPNGATYALWIWVGPKATRVDSQMYYLSSGGEADDSNGIAMYKDTTGIQAEFTANGTQYGPVNVPMTNEQWYHIVLIWHFISGLDIYLNGQIVRSDRLGKPAPGAENKYSNFYFGRPNDVTDSQDSSVLGQFVLDDFKFWDKGKDADFVQNLFISYERCKCKLFEKSINRLQCSLPWISSVFKLNYKLLNLTIPTALY